MKASEDKVMCCEIGCDRLAEFVLVFGETTDDVCEVCETHVGVQIPDTAHEVRIHRIG